MGSTEIARLFQPRLSTENSLQPRVYAVGDCGYRHLFGFPIIVKPDGSIMVHPSLAPALSDACRQLDFADCIAALCVSEEAPLPAVLAMYGCEGKDGLRWSTPASQSPLPLPHKGSTLELEGHLTVQRWLYDLIERVASSVPVLPPNMNPDETAALQLFDDMMETLVGLKEIKERLRNFVLSVIHDGR